jgi:hypothetical protein
MSKRVKKRIVIAVSLMALIAFVYFAYGFFESHKSLIESGYYWLVHDSDNEPNPNALSDYPDNKTGEYLFDPRTVLASQERGRTDMFTPSSVDPNILDVEYDNISWTQSDFLSVANTLSQKVWNEPLDLDGWSVYFVFFEGGCNDDFGGFHSFEITYYKTIKTDWETVYTARHLELTPWIGVAKWGGDGNFSTPSIFGWKNIELTKFKTTAEQAVRIADENGGKKARVNSENKCLIYAYTVEDSNWMFGYNWYVYYFDTATPFSAFVDPFSGEVHSTK